VAHQVPWSRSVLSPHMLEVHSLTLGSSLEHTKPLILMPTSASTMAAKLFPCLALLSGKEELVVTAALHLPLPPHLSLPLPRKRSLLHLRLWPPLSFLPQLPLRLPVGLALWLFTDSVVDKAFLELLAVLQVLARK
jgi:hypothetical protein